MYNNGSNLDRIAQDIIAAAPTAMVVATRTGRIVLANRSAEALFGYEYGELTGRAFEELIAHRWSAVAQQLGGAVADVFDQQGRRKSGEAFPIDLSLRDLPDHELVVCTIADASAHKRTEFELLDSEARFRNMADHSPVMIWVTDSAGQCVYLSRLWYEFTGQTPETALGGGWTQAVHPEDHARNLELFRRSSLERSGVQLEYRLRRHDGEYRWCLDACTPRFSATGKLLGHIGSVMDITERKEAEQALKEADQRKDEFLATLAHELRNPLAPIMSAVHYLQMQATSDANARSARDIIERQTRQLARLVDDLLDVSRITRGRINLQKEHMSLGVAVMNALDACRPLISASGHSLRVHIPEEPLFIYGDLARLSQVFVNLLNNAAKYTPAGGVVAVTVEQRGAHALVRVTDTGVGIPTHMLQQIFDIFVQVDTTLERSRGGLGIGLTLAQQLTHMHGGRIEARSAGAGCGSEFCVYLPLAQQAVFALHAPTSDVLTSFTHRRVLVADDNHDAAETLKLLLETAGHEVHTAHNGAEACTLAAQLQPHIALLDIGMPELSGYEVAQRIRALTHGDRVLLVALTGWGQQQDKQRAREAGFDHHLTKPVDPDALLRLVAHLPPPQPSR